MARESAIVIVVSELEPIVSPVRRWYDPAASQGVPPHITLLYPWREPPLMGEDLQAVQAAISGIEPYVITFRGVGRFERTLFLQPDDRGETKALIARLTERFPEHPPYGGRVTDAVPHLTIAEVAGDLEPILNSYAPSLLAALPVEVEVRDVCVLESRDDGQWIVAARIPLAAP
jgi:2'-5' RNA ligase